MSCAGTSQTESEDTQDFEKQGSTRRSSLVFLAVGRHEALFDPLERSVSGCLSWTVNNRSSVGVRSFPPCRKDETMSRDVLWPEFLRRIVVRLRLGPPTKLASAELANRPPCREIAGSKPAPPVPLTPRQGRYVAYHRTAVFRE